MAAPPVSPLKKKKGQNDQPSWTEALAFRIMDSEIGQWLMDRKVYEAERDRSALIKKHGAEKIITALKNDKKIIDSYLRYTQAAHRATREEAAYLDLMIDSQGSAENGAKVKELRTLIGSRMEDAQRTQDSDKQSFLELRSSQVRQAVAALRLPEKEQANLISAVDVRVRLNAGPVPSEAQKLNGKLWFELPKSEQRAALSTITKRAEPLISRLDEPSNALKQNAIKALAAKETNATAKIDAYVAVNVVVRELNEAEFTRAEIHLKEAIEQFNKAYPTPDEAHKKIKLQLLAAQESLEKLNGKTPANTLMGPLPVGAPAKQQSLQEQRKP